MTSPKKILKYNTNWLITISWFALTTVVYADGQVAYFQRSGINVSSAQARALIDKGKTQEIRITHNAGVPEGFSVDRLLRGSAAQAVIQEYYGLAQVTAVRQAEHNAGIRQGATNRHLRVSEDQLRQREAVLEATQIDLRDREAALRATEVALREREAALREAERRLQETEVQLRNANNEIENAKTNIDQLTVLNTRTTAEHARLTAELEKEKADPTRVDHTRVNELEISLKEQAEQAEELRNQSQKFIEKLQKVVEKLLDNALITGDNRERLRKALNEFAKNPKDMSLLKVLKLEIEKLNSSIENLQKEKEKNLAVINDSKTSIENLQKEKEKDLAVINESKSRIENLHKEKEKDLAVINESKSRIENLQKQKEKDLAVIEEQDATIAKLTAQVNNYGESEGTNKDKHEQLIRQLEELKVNPDKKLVKNLQNEIKMLKEELERKPAPPPSRPPLPPKKTAPPPSGSSTSGSSGSSNTPLNPELSSGSSGSSNTPPPVGPSTPSNSGSSSSELSSREITREEMTKLASIKKIVQFQEGNYVITEEGKPKLNNQNGYTANHFIQEKGTVYFPFGGTLWGTHKIPLTDDIVYITSDRKILKLAELKPSDFLVVENSDVQTPLLSYFSGKFEKDTVILVLREGK